MISLLLASSRNCRVSAALAVNHCNFVLYVYCVYNENTMEVSKMFEYITLLVVLGVGTVGLSIHYLRKAGFDVFSLHKGGH